MSLMVPDATEAEEYAALLEKIEREHAVPCAGYKDRCIRRRIGVRMRANGLHTFSEYSNLLDRSAGEWDKLLAALTINVTRFFRDASAFAALENEAIPELSRTFSDTLDVWSAGCSHGQEPYSLAMAMAERVGLDRFRVEATDVDVESLAAARTARYSPESIADIPESRRKLWLSGDEHAQIGSALRARVTVLRHDLLRDPIAEQRFHLIVCRNVIIYFSRDAQAALFERLYRALKPGGVLMLGKVETLLGPARDTFQPLNLRERLFRRPVQ